MRLVTARICLGYHDFALPGSGSRWPPRRRLQVQLSRLQLEVVKIAYLARSSSMPAKQRELDDVVRQIYNFLHDADTRDGTTSLLVVIGDHGMTDQGNHGGSSPAETSAVRLLFVVRQVPS